MSGDRFCPVCWQPAGPPRHGRIARHPDRADNRCPGGGQPYRIAIAEPFEPDWLAISIAVENRDWHLTKRLRREEQVEVLCAIHARGTDATTIAELIGWKPDTVQAILRKAKRDAA